jgi:hypothetical protein
MTFFPEACIKGILNILYKATTRNNGGSLENMATIEMLSSSIPRLLILPTNVCMTAL